MRRMISIVVATASFCVAVHSLALKPGADAPPAASVDSTLSALVQTAAIVEGTVSSVSYEYTEQTGPWTAITLTGLVVHRGQLRPGAGTPEKLVLRQRGGEYPDGRVLIVSSVPHYEQGKRYVTFLRNTSWNLSPVVGGAALRVEDEGGRQYLVGQESGALTAVTAGGMSFSEPLFSEPDRTAKTGAHRLVSKAVPGSALNVQGLLAGVDQQLLFRGLKLEGTFYDEPLVRSKTLAVAPASPDSRAAAPSENEASKPDKRPQ